MKPTRRPVPASSLPPTARALLAACGPVAPAPRPCPTMRFHKGTGGSYAAWRVGKRRFWRYFGKWGSEKARRQYAIFRAGWKATIAALTN